MLKCQSTSDAIKKSKIRLILSTGSVLSASLTKAIKREFGKPVLSLSGGTEIGCALLVGYCDKIPTDGWLGAQALGIKVENGEQTRMALGNWLESSLPALPIGMINTGEQRSIKTSYFPNDVNIWEHGDLVRSNSLENSR